MTVIERNTNRANMLHLKEDFSDGKKMVLFLGAGINSGTGSGIDLSWFGLLNALFDAAFTLLSLGKGYSSDERIKLQSLICGNKEQMVQSTWDNLHSFTESEFPPLVQASIVKSVLGKNYIDTIRKHLYQQCDKKVMKDLFVKYYRIGANPPNAGKPFYSLFQIAKLIILYRPITAVVTYNFDKFLTMAIEILQEEYLLFFSKEEIDDNGDKLNRKIVDVYGASNHSKQKDDFLPIYHIHGYIPPYNEFLPIEDNRIVLSMEEFYENTQNVYSWQTATQLHLLCHFTCLFLGSSLTDINTQRMIHYASKMGNDDRIYYLHAATKSIEKIGKDDFESYLNLMNLKDTFYTRYGLTPIFEREGYNKLYDNILNLIR